MNPREKRILRWALLFLAPNLTGFLIFTSLPVFFSFGLAFFQWDTFSAPRFIGFDNFIRLLTDPKLWFYLYNTVFLMIGLPLSIGGSLILAIVLSQKLRGIIVYRTVFYLPTVTNGVALFLLWKWLYNPKYGLVNSILLPILSWPYFSLAVRVAILLLIGLVLKSLARKAMSERPAPSPVRSPLGLCALLGHHRPIRVRRLLGLAVGTPAPPRWFQQHRRLAQLAFQ